MRAAAAFGDEEEGHVMAKKILIAQCVLLGLAVLALLVNEIPGAVREVRMWRIASFRRGSATQGRRTS